MLQPYKNPELVKIGGAVDGQNAKKGKEEALTLWINPAEWMYCSTGGEDGQEDGGGERGERT